MMVVCLSPPPSSSFFSLFSILIESWDIRSVLLGCPICVTAKCFEWTEWPKDSCKLPRYVYFYHAKWIIEDLEHPVKEWWWLMIRNYSQLFEVSGLSLKLGKVVKCTWNSSAWEAEAKRSRTQGWHGLYVRRHHLAQNHSKETMSTGWRCSLAV